MMIPPPSGLRETPNREAKSKRKRFDDEIHSEVATLRATKKARPSLSKIAAQQLVSTDEVDHESRVPARIELCDKMRELLESYAGRIGMIDVEALDGCLIEMVCACTPSAAAHLRRQEMQDLKTQLSSQWADITSLQDEHTATLEGNTAFLQETASSLKKQLVNYQREVRQQLEERDAQHRTDMQALLAAINQKTLSSSGEVPPPWSPMPKETITERFNNAETKSAKERNNIKPRSGNDKQVAIVPGSLPEQHILPNTLQKSYIRDVIDHVAIRVFDTAIALGIPRWILGD